MLAFGTVLAVTILGSIDPFALLLGAALVVAVVLLDGRLALPRPSRRWGLAIDVAIIVLVLLAVPDLVVFPLGRARSATRSRRDHPVPPELPPRARPTRCSAGDAMLVDTASQYGVGSIYLLAGWFQLAPIGYGTLGFLSGALAALLFAAGYGVLRMAGTSRLLAASAIAVGVVTLIFNLIYPIDAHPPGWAAALRAADDRHRRRGRRRALAALAPRRRGALL